jgi:hypothetical protein
LKLDEATNISAETNPNLHRMMTKFALRSGPRAERDMLSLPGNPGEFQVGKVIHFNVKVNGKDRHLDAPLFDRYALMAPIAPNQGNPLPPREKRTLKAGSISTYSFVDPQGDMTFDFMERYFHLTMEKLRGWAQQAREEARKESLSKAGAYGFVPNVPVKIKNMPEPFRGFIKLELEKSRNASGGGAIPLPSNLDDLEITPTRMGGSFEFRVEGGHSTRWIL